MLRLKDMNKIFSSLLLASSALAFTACVGEQAEIFDKSAAERLDEIKGVYAQRMVADGGAWVMEYYPTNEAEAPKGSGYLMTCRFTPDYRVTVAMNNEVTSNLYTESTSCWEILTDDGPVLSFNSYNDVLHTFSTPMDIPSTKDDDELGRGYEGDYEFVITRLEENCTDAMLKGKKRGTYNRLTRLPAGTDFKQYISDVESFKNSKFPVGGNDLRFTLNGKLHYVKNMGGMMPNIYPADGDVVINKDLRTYLIIKKDGKYYLRFREAFGEGDQKEQEFVYNEDNDEFVGVVNSENALRGISDDELPYYLNGPGGTVMGFGVTETVSRSALFEQMVNAISEGFSNYKSYVLNSIRLTVTDEGTALNLVLNYKVNRSTKSVALKAKFTANEAGILIDEWQSTNSDGRDLLAGIPALKTFVEKLTGQYDIKVVGSRLNISEMRFDSMTDSEFWFSSICK